MLPVTRIRRTGRISVRRNGNQSESQVATDEELDLVGSVDFSPETNLRLS